MMKSKKILTIMLILIGILLIGTLKVQAASSEIYASKTTAEVGENVTVTVKFTAAAWNIKVSGNGISGASYASQTSDLSEAQNVKEFKLDTSKAGQYTISMSGDITDSNGNTIEIKNKSCTVKVNEKTVTPTPTPSTNTDEPKVEESPKFVNANKTMYAANDMNLRASWSTNSKATKIAKNTQLTVIATSTNKVNGYVWYKVKYNNQTLYAASNLLTSQKEEETKTEEPKVEEPKTEEPKNNDANENNTPKSGLKSLEIEGITISPAFSSDVYEYRAVVKEDIKELKINAVTATETSTIVIAGNDNLQEGENLITIIVYNAKGEAEATYQITTNKNTLDLENTDKLLKAENKESRRNLIIFISILTIAIIALIVTIILKHRNVKQKNENEEDYNEDELTDSVRTVENVEKKRKGKHF